MFVDQVSRPYSEANTDEAVAIAAKAGLPPITLDGLRNFAA